VKGYNILIAEEKQFQMTVDFKSETMESGRKCGCFGFDKYLPNDKGLVANMWCCWEVME
jgi:hypothetical protein